MDRICSCNAFYILLKVFCNTWIFNVNLKQEVHPKILNAGRAWPRVYFKALRLAAYYASLIFFLLFLSEYMIGAAVMRVTTTAVDVV